MLYINKKKYKAELKFENNKCLYNQHLRVPMSNWGTILNGANSIKHHKRFSAHT